MTVPFPDSGIKKQDDAHSGCDLLKRAVALDRSENENATESQLDLILKWVMLDWSALTSVRGFYVGTNAIGGPIPDSIGSMIINPGLNLSNNLLTGALPSTVNSMVETQTLLVKNNQLIDCSCSCS